MHLKYHAQFLLDKEKDKPDAKIRYRIKWQGNIVAFNVGYRVDIQKWSNEVQRCKANTTHGKNKIPASIINQKIQKFEQVCQEIFKTFEVRKEIPTKIEFQSLFNKQVGRKQKETADKNFFDYFDEFITQQCVFKQWSYSTKARYLSLKKHLYEFDKNLKFSSLTEKNLLNFILFLQSNFHTKNSSTSKILVDLKSFLKWSFKKGYNRTNAFEDFKPTLKTISKKIIFLTPTEFNLLRDYQIPNDKKYLEQVRDIFLFLCFTGLRYSDILNLKKSNIKENFIELTTIKTITNLKIELNNHSRAILEKYKDFVSDENLALPVLSKLKINDYLRELAELVGIDEPINEVYYLGNQRIEKTTPKYALLTTHAGRRTFVCNALYLGISPQTIMKWTGHRDYQSMKPYMDVADEIKAKSMEKFNLL